MTILSKVISKVKTLIEYAKWGMFICKAINGEVSDEVCPPKAFSNMYKGRYATQLTINNHIWLNYTKKFSSPYVTDFGGSNCLGSVVEVIDLPNCINVGDYQWSGANKSLKVLKLSGLRYAGISFTQNCSALEYVEFGALTGMPTTLFTGSKATMKEIYVGERTACNLHFQQCPNLIQESLHDIIDKVADRTGESALTLYVHQEAYDRISEEYKTKLSNKNWNLAVGS